jgi:hypothetical protein
VGRDAFNGRERGGALDDGRYDYDGDCNLVDEYAWRDRDRPAFHCHRASGDA